MPDNNTTDDDELNGFAATDIEFVYEPNVGLTIHAYRPSPWLSWEETQELAAWLAERVKGAP